MTELLIIIIVVVAVLAASLGAFGLRRRSVRRLARRGASEGRSSATALEAPPRPAPPAEVIAPPHPAPSPGAPLVKPAEAPAPEAPAPEAPAPEAPAPEAPAPEAPTPVRLRDRLARARATLGAPLSAIRRRERIDEDSFEALEEALLLADVGLPTTEALLAKLRERVRSGGLDGGAEALLAALREDITALFAGEDRSLARLEDATTVWLMVGVNGVGKTTTIGKLASREQREGRRVVLAAGDTFRAAAGEQLDIWAQRSGADLVRGADGADPSSVVFDAIQHASAKGGDLVIADTAGRLHTKVNLMEELKKIRRIADRPPGHVSEVLLVIDATTGQNGLVQARQFTEAVGVTGVVLTKLDGTAKGGVVLAIRAELGLPIKLVGLGEGVEDLVAFDPEEFVTALFA